MNVTIDPINDAPTLEEIADPDAIEEDASEQTVILEGITPGPGESGAVIVTATSDNTGLIPDPNVAALQPDGTAQLTYTPVAEQFGSALITVTVTDTEMDYRTALETFTVEVLAVYDAPEAVNDTFEQTVSFVDPADPDDWTVRVWYGDGGEYGVDPADSAFTTGDTQFQLDHTYTSLGTHTVHFVKTGEVLPPGNYTVTLTSGADAWKDTTGVLLDGDSNYAAGSDYVKAFEVALSSGRVVSLPDFARGPGQMVNVPAIASGLPISLSDGTGVVAGDPRPTRTTTADHARRPQPHLGHFFR